MLLLVSTIDMTDMLNNSMNTSNLKKNEKFFCQKVHDHTKCYKQIFHNVEDVA